MISTVVCINNEGYEFLKIGDPLIVPYDCKEKGFISFLTELQPLNDEEIIRVPFDRFMELNEYKNLIVKKRYELV